MDLMFPVTLGQSLKFKKDWFLKDETNSGV